MEKFGGIFAAGRGAFAGPLSFAAGVFNKQFYGLHDSKKLTAKKREELFKEIIKSSNFLIIYFSNAQIDELGLSECLRRALKIFKAHFDGFEIIYDGNLDYGVGITTMIKADSKVAGVSAASILAKVSRDSLMRGWDKIYSKYGFAGHKGYGTKAHLDAIAKFGYSSLHRKSFVVKSFEKSLFD